MCSSIVCLRIEETWRLWQKFLDDYARFEDWLKISERTAAFPSSSGVLYTVAKEELKKFEVIRSSKYSLLFCCGTSELVADAPGHELTNVARVICSTAGGWLASHG